MLRSIAFSERVIVNNEQDETEKCDAPFIIIII